MAKEGKRQVMAIRRAWPQLRDIAWRWDPIGLGEETRAVTDDEYDCVIDFVVGRLQTSPDAAGLAEETFRFVREDMGISASSADASAFVSDVRRVMRGTVG